MCIHKCFTYYFYDGQGFPNFVKEGVYSKMKILWTKNTEFLGEKITDLVKQKDSQTLRTKKLHISCEAKGSDFMKKAFHRFCEAISFRDFAKQRISYCCEAKGFTDFAKQKVSTC